LNSLSYRRALKLATSIFIATTVAACSGSDKPSESEARTALQAYLGNCQYIDISDFRKVNGIPQQDGSYIVETNFTATLNPPDKIKDFVASSHNPDLDANASLLVRQQYAPIALSINIQKIINTYRQDCPNMPRRLIEKIYNSNIDPSNRTLDDYAKTYSVQVTQSEVHLIKTDTGWQLAQ